MRPQETNIEGRRIRVRGLVQGVGFRPHVWRLARECSLTGHVLNDGGGVAIEAWGLPENLQSFILRLTHETLPLARVESVQSETLAGKPDKEPFRIAASEGGTISTGVIPDAATCPSCLNDILDPDNRRYGYAFTNCTHCGPRLSIVHAIPYDRARTSMRAFPMCESCQREYDDPSDRRFHAQPNACHVCGPRLWLEDRSGTVECVDAIAEAVQRIGAGAIAAIKGIGGFHLACDATNDHAVAELRRRKRRAAKPLALMARDLDQMGRFCQVSDAEAELLQSPAAPIVLLHAAGDRLAEAVAPGRDRIGFMLPYTPLHHLLMRQLDRPIVLTSGNLSDEPQLIGNNEARERLMEIADCWLMHDREIVNRLDDSVMRVDAPGRAILRRARGLAPEPVSLAPAFADAPPVLAMGGELKSTFCLVKNGQAILSQHMGDLEEAATHADYRKNLDLYRRIFRFDPEVIAVDDHPDYLSTQWGEALASETGARLVRVQHHHAHLAACLAEHCVPPEDDLTLGIILDGLGLGRDGTIWGGEFLVGGYGAFRRVGHFKPVALPGGRRAIGEPWRNTVAHLHAAFGPAYSEHIRGTPLESFLTGKPLPIIERMIERGLNAPLSSSAGRLFDAVAGAAGICRERQDYEGQAAMEMEALARPFIGREPAYPVHLNQDDVTVLCWTPLWEQIASDLKAGIEAGRIAARFHAGLAKALARAACALARANNIDRIVLSGGVMQNAILLESLHNRLIDEGFAVLTHRRVPANDGGLALGQAAICASLSSR